MSNLKIKFGKRLKELRKQKNINQETFAELINISPRNLSKIETGKTFPSTENLEKIIKTLDCNASKLFQFEHLNDDTSLKESLVNSINNLNDEEVRILYKIIKSI